MIRYSPFVTTTRNVSRGSFRAKGPAPAMTRDNRLFNDTVIRTGFTCTPWRDLPERFRSSALITYIEALEAEAVIPSKKRTIQCELNTNLYPNRNEIERFSVASRTAGTLLHAMGRLLVTTGLSCMRPPSRHCSCNYRYILIFIRLYS